ncbi:hypothetical protein [Chondromyces apiculatus]|uniref:AsmA domain-containing protein n=1 Tax=Chondromyces apiculatus DSM 436 TaxID=1192034 RepID=A0A017TGL0_9BACT|nr:hypothetical protein [Chondromyces apiculatus]EYF07955.1 Hypothetical protein CAP_6977 [Chondromyces apiculatus DSM 436]
MLALVVVVAACAGLVALFLPDLVRAEVVRQARARGILLDPGKVSFTREAVTLRGARFSLVDVTGTEGTIQRVVIRLDGLAPRDMQAEGVTFLVTGYEALPALQAWTAARYADVASVPLAAREVRLGFREQQSAAETAEKAVLAAASLTLAPTQGAAEVALKQARVIVAQREVATAEVTGKLDAEGVIATLLATLPGAGAKPSVEIALRRPPEPDVRVRLSRTSLDALATALGLTLGAPGVVVGGTAELRLPTVARGPFALGVDLALDGYVPPHPRELDGILFGKTTSVKAQVRIPSGGDGARLPDADLHEVEVSAGALQLRGKGSVRGEVADAVLTLSLTGAVPCTQLTTSVVAAHLGQGLGTLAGRLAQRALAGSVAVAVRVEGRASRFDAPRVETSAQVGCRLSF